MSGKKRITLSPVLKEHKFIYDLMKNTTSDYAFMMDPVEGIFLASPSFVQAYDLPAETLENISGVLEPFVYMQDRKPLASLFASVRGISRGCVSKERLVLRKTARRISLPERSVSSHGATLQIP